MSRYEELRHSLDTSMLSASSLPTKAERQSFINQSFTRLYQAYQQKQVSHAEYVRLINRLGVYRQGEFNDYIDILAGAAHLGMLEIAIKGEIADLSPQAARERRDIVTDLTGLDPIEPE